MMHINIDDQVFDAVAADFLKRDMKLQVECIMEDAKKYAEDGKSVHITNILEHAETYLALERLAKYYGG